jgi:hypothetical protein
LHAATGMRRGVGAVHVDQQICRSIDLLLIHIAGS